MNQIEWEFVSIIDIVSFILSLSSIAAYLLFFAAMLGFKVISSTPLLANILMTS